MEGAGIEKSVFDVTEDIPSYRLLDLSQKTRVKGWKYLLPYAYLDRFGAYQIVVKQNKVFFIGVYGC